MQGIRGMLQPGHSPPLTSLSTTDVLCLLFGCPILGVPTIRGLLFGVCISHSVFVEIPTWFWAPTP